MDPQTPTDVAPDTGPVLLVDDSVLELRAWKRELEADGLRVCTAENLAQTLEAVQTEKPHIAIVDLFLGNTDEGLEVIRQIKAIDPNVFVVLVSGDLSVAYAMAAVRAGADDVLVKPFLASEVVRRIKHGEAADPERANLTLEQVEWEHISRALLETNKNITQAAERLGIYRQTLQRKLRKRGRGRDEN